MLGSKVSEQISGLTVNCRSKLACCKEGGGGPNAGELVTQIRGNNIHSKYIWHVYVIVLLQVS